MVQEVTGVKVLSLHHDISTVTGEEVVIFTLAGAPDIRESKSRLAAPNEGLVRVASSSRGRVSPIEVRLPAQRSELRRGSPRWDGHEFYLGLVRSQDHRTVCSNEWEDEHGPAR